MNQSDQRVFEEQLLKKWDKMGSVQSKIRVIIIISLQ